MNINIVVSPLEPSVDALTKLNDDGSYTIFVNNKLCEDRARKAILHEVFHIKNNDFNDFHHASLIERMLRESNFLDEELDGINFYYHVI